jgi:hypothetical protein
MSTSDTKTETFTGCVQVKNRGVEVVALMRAAASECVRCTHVRE